jgi:hypothetical protein
METRFKELTAAWRNRARIVPAEIVAIRVTLATARHIRVSGLMVERVRSHWMENENTGNGSIASK